MNPLFMVFLCITFLVSQCNGQVTMSGRCPRISAMPNFDFARYIGVWYEVEKYFFLPEITGTCVYVRYKNLQSDNTTFEADIVQVEAITRKHIVSPSNGRIVSQDGSAEIDLVVSVIIPLSPIVVKVDYPYFVLDTDYENYSIKWSCRQISPTINIQSIWILSKSRSYPTDLRNFVHDKLRSHYGLRSDLLKLTDQYNCPMPREE